MGDIMRIGTIKEAEEGKKIFDKIFSELNLEQALEGDRSQTNCDIIDAKIMQLAQRLNEAYPPRKYIKEKHA
jgi:predicted secreted Zn-dependent protease